MNLVKGKTSKKAKAEPTKEDVHAVIVDILKEVDFNTVSNNTTLIGWLKLCQLYDLIFWIYLLQATLSDILRQLGRALICNIFFSFFFFSIFSWFNLIELVFY